MSTEQYSELLLQEASPALYRTNAFRLTELPVDATARNFANREQMLRMAQSTGLSIPPGPGRALSLNGTVDSLSLSEASQRIHDPEQRLIHELFWFWPHQLGKSKEDKALAALAAGDVELAESIWIQQEQTQSEANVSVHNLAVLSHATALDLEQLISKGALSDEQKRILNRAWNDAYSRWRLLLGHEEFWNRLTARIRDLDDPRLTTDTAQRIRSTLPMALLDINAQLAVQGARLGNKVTALRHVGIMQNSGFDSKLVMESLQKALKGTRSQITMSCEKARHDGAQDPKNADKTVDALYDATTPLLSTMDLILPMQNATRSGAHDEVANQALATVIAYCEKTKNWARAVTLLEASQKVADSKSVCDKIQAIIKTIKLNIADEVCWFCQKLPLDDASAIQVKMYGNVKESYVFGGPGRTRVQWQTLTVKVPRCASCKSVHKRRARGLDGCLVSLAPIIVVEILITVMWAPDYFLHSSRPDFKDLLSAYIYAGLFTLMLITPIVHSIYRKITNKITDKSDVKRATEWVNHPRLVESQRQGWTIGEKPPGVKQ